MIRLNLFGEIALLGPDGESILRILQQPKRLALLAYLVLDGSPGASRSRDKALLLFWPDATEKRARNALSQNVHFLRRWLGPDVIIDHGQGGLGIDSGALWCDAVAFRQATARGEWAEALRLYRGDLLGGFGISAGPEFEHWLDEQRSQLRRDAAASAWMLADAAGVNGRDDEATAWGHRAVELSLDDERAVQRLLRLLTQFGNGGGALEAYERFRARLAREYDATPSGETRQLIAGIRAGSGARSSIESPGIAEPRRAANNADEAPPETDRGRLDATATAPDVPMLRSMVMGRAPIAPDAGAPMGRMFGKQRLWAVTIVLCLVASATLYRGARAHTVESGVAAPDATTQIVVDSLVDIGSSLDSGQIGTTLTAAVIDRLVRVHSFNVVSEPPEAAGHLVQSIRPAGPTFLVTGHVVHSGGRVHVDVAVTDRLSSRILKTGAFEHAAGAPLPLTDTLSREIASLVQATVGREAEHREWRKYSNSEHVYGLMREASDQRDRADTLAQKGNFQTAVSALDGADSLLRAVELITPGWTTPPIERAEVSQQLASLYAGPLRDAPHAASFLSRGILQAAVATASHPHDAAALSTLGSLYYWYWLTVPMSADSTARMLASAEENLRAAVAADPSRARAWELLSASLYARADYSDAYLAARRAYASDSYLHDSEDILNRLFLTAYEINDDSASGAWCGEAERRFPRSWTSAYCQLALLAWSHSTDPRSTSVAWSIARAGAAGSVQPRQAGPRLEMLTAAVLARRRLRDSANAVIRRARSHDPGDDELLPLEADARIALGERDVARALIEQYVDKRPLHRAGVAHSRRFRALQPSQVTAERE